MRKEDQVCTIEQAIRLKELGVDQESLFCYTGGGSENLPYQLELTDYVFTELAAWAYEDRIAAFSVAELGLMLPGHILHPVLQKNSWVNYPEIDKVFATEAQARAAIVILAIESGVLKVEDFNPQLTR